jgi:hypothetical protein
MADALRPMGIGPLVRHARALGHDGVILRSCQNTTLSLGAESDLFFVFDVEQPTLAETIQEGLASRPAKRGGR